MCLLGRVLSKAMLYLSASHDRTHPVGQGQTGRGQPQLRSILARVNHLLQVRVNGTVVSVQKPSYASDGTASYGNDGIKTTTYGFTSNLVNRAWCKGCRPGHQWCDLPLLRHACPEHAAAHQCEQHSGQVQC